jgi:hypothetical protein
MLVITPNYRPGYRPAIGAEPAGGDITGWQCLLATFHPDGGEETPCDPQGVVSRAATRLASTGSNNFFTMSTASMKTKGGDL